MPPDEIKPGVEPETPWERPGTIGRAQVESVVREVLAGAAGGKSEPRPSRYVPRLLPVLLLAVVLLAGVAVVSPQQLPVLLYKLAMVTVGAYVGYLLDRTLFPYARPDGYLARDWREHGADYPDNEPDHAVVSGYESVFAAALLRRALVILAVVLAVGMAL